MPSFLPSRATVRSAWTALRAWNAARWWTAVGGSILTALVIGVPTAVIPTPFFGRQVPVQWWNYPALAATAVLGGLVFATYVRVAVPSEERASFRLGTTGGVLAFFAVGCPVCNKLVLVLLGTSGAMTLWAPVQPVVSVVSVLLLAVAAVRRLVGEVACPTRPAPATTPDAGRHGD